MNGENLKQKPGTKSPEAKGEVTQQTKAETPILTPSTITGSNPKAKEAVKAPTAKEALLVERDWLQEHIRKEGIPEIARVGSFIACSMAGIVLAAWQLTEFIARFPAIAAGQAGLALAGGLLLGGILYAGLGAISYTRTRGLQDRLEDVERELERQGLDKT